MSDFTMPSLGADMESGTLLEWLVHPGDPVHRGDLMAVVDTDKAAVEIESFTDGVVERLVAEPGTRVPVGGVLATFADGAGAAGTVAPAVPVTAAPAAGSTPLHPAPVATPPVRHYADQLGVDLSTVTGTGRDGHVTRADVTRAAAAAASAEPPPPGPAPAPAPAAAPGARRRISPRARRLAAELGVDPALLRGAGPGGEVREADVRAAAATAAPTPAAPAAPAAAPAPAGAPAGADRTERSTIAALMSRSKREIPHYYVATTVDLLALTDWLRQLNRDLPVTGRIVPAAALLRAVALGLRQMPELNGFWVGDAFVPGEAVHLGVAISVRHGALVAPAIHDAADLGLTETMAGLRDLVRRARSGRLTRAELTDPTVTVTDLGDQGVEEVIGVITPPQVALVGIGRIVDRPWAVDGMLGVRPVVRLTLSGDHRATDGMVGARFLALVDELLQRPEEL